MDSIVVDNCENSPLDLSRSIYLSKQIFMETEMKVRYTDKFEF